MAPLKSRKSIHPPYQKLKGFMREHNITLNDIARLLGCTTSTISLKINGKSDFYLNEANKIIDTYGANNDIFLS